MLDSWQPGEMPMLNDMLEKRGELLDAVDHACLQIKHMAKRYSKPRKEPARMPQAQGFDFRPLLKTSEG